MGWIVQIVYMEAIVKIKRHINVQLDFQRQQGRMTFHSASPLVAMLHITLPFYHSLQV